MLFYSALFFCFACLQGDRNIFGFSGPQAKDNSVRSLLLMMRWGVALMQQNVSQSFYSDGMEIGEENLIIISKRSSG